MSRALVPVFLAIALAACAAVHDARDESTLAGVPGPAARTLRVQAGAAPLDEVEREGDRYEASWRDGAGRHEAEVAADGRLIEREDPIATSAVPAAVARGLAAAHPAGRVVRWVKKTMGTGGVVRFEVVIEIDGRRRERLFAPDGSPAREDDDDGDDRGGEGDDEDDDDDEGGGD